MKEKGAIFKMNLYISDLHFGHTNVIRFDHRPFSDVKEMDHALIHLWNSRVNPEACQNSISPDNQTIK